MYKISCLLVFLFIFFNTRGQPLPPSEQLIVVTTANWDATNGKLAVYEWKNEKWNSVLTNIPIVVGRNGLAWGKGLHDEKFNTGILKKEGDGRSPAGIFPITQLFGYEDISAKMNYLKVDKNTFCVDDPSSKYYNQIVHTDTVSKDWKSAETMRLNGDDYKYGIVVGYNTDAIQAGKGSCIFLHLWDTGKSPTSGCTAMTEEILLKLFSFLDKNKNPLIVQVPQEEYNKLKELYKLP